MRSLFLPAFVLLARPLPTVVFRRLPACLLLQSELVGKSEKDAYALPAANLVMLRLSRDELGFRPLAVAGELQVGGVGWSGGGGVG